jgi:epsin
MPMIYRRFTEKSAEEWRQIYKALQLLEFLIKHGSERVIDDARGHITLLKMLRQFHFIDQNGKDQGINVRNRAKELADMLGDVERIRAERKKARASKNKYTGVEGGAMGGFSSGSSSRYGGYGNDSGPGGYGGYSGGVYGDGGGFGGQTSDFQDTSSRADKFEEYDEFDEADKPSESSTRPKRTTERASVTKKAAEPPKKKAPEVDLFSFDDPAPSSSAAPLPSNGSGLASLSTSAADEDEFDDFQSATPATQTTMPISGLAQPLPPPITSTASTTAHFAAPKPVSAPQQANLTNMVGLSSISPTPSASATPSVNYSAFSSPPAVSQPPKPAGYQASAPNYFQSVQTTATPQASIATTPGMSMGSSMSSLKPATSNASKPAGAGGDAFGALWSQASTGIKKTNTTPAGPAMGQLAKEKSSAGIWGAPASSATTKPAGGSNAFGDLI